MSKCDYVTNNIAETFNSWIRNEKSEPIIPLMDRIRQKIMKKHKIRRDLVTTMKGRILPHIMLHLCVNYCVFDGGTPSLSRVMTTFREDVQQWSVAGARGASYLLALPPTS